MNYLLDLLLFGAGFFTGFLVFRGHLKVRTRSVLPPEGSKLGPCREVRLDEHWHWFTAHEMDTSNERAEKFRKAP